MSPLSAQSKLRLVKEEVQSLNDNQYLDNSSGDEKQSDGPPPSTGKNTVFVMKSSGGFNVAPQQKVKKVRPIKLPPRERVLSHLD
jgi:hypothetical protein